MVHVSLMQCIRGIQLCFVVCFSDLPATGCTNGEVRLVAREAETSGLVEVCVGGTWTSVCFDMWGINEARVTCRQLNRVVGM